MHGQLQKRLRDFVQGERNESCWPSMGHLLLLRLVGHVFAVTDFEVNPAAAAIMTVICRYEKKYLHSPISFFRRFCHLSCPPDVMSAQHALVGPASLLLCQCLSQCPVRTAADVASGLLSCSVLAGFTRETKRLVPEAFEFVRSVLVLFSPTSTISPTAATVAAASSSSSSRSKTSAAAAAAGKDKHKAAAAIALACPPQKTFDVPAAGSSSSSQGQALQALRSAAARLGRAKQSTSSSSSSSSKDVDSGGSSGDSLQIVWTAFGKDRSGDQSYPGRSIISLPPIPQWLLLAHCHDGMISYLTFTHTFLL